MSISLSEGHSPQWTVHSEGTCKIKQSTALCHLAIQPPALLQLMDTQYNHTGLRYTSALAKSACERTHMAEAFQALAGQPS